MTRSYDEAIRTGANAGWAVCEAEGYQAGHDYLRSIAAKISKKYSVPAVQVEDDLVEAVTD